MTHLQRKPTSELVRLEAYATEGPEARRLLTIVNDWRDARESRRRLIERVDAWRRGRASMSQNPKERERIEREIGTSRCIVYGGTARGLIDLQKIN